MFTLKKDPVTMQVHVFERIPGTTKIHDRFEKRNIILSPVEKVCVANKQEENSTFEEDISKNFDSNAGFDIEI